MTSELPFTGERFVPGTAGEIWYEHWHRYHFAAPLVAGRRVLDVACGEGYGSALLARRARQVTGADIAAAAIAHARARYAGHANLEFCLADCAALPFADASFDVVVSFETIEHIAAQQAFVREVRRVLRPDGFVVLSCPNKAEYTDARDYVNEFHVRELYRDEFAGLVAAEFPHVAWYGQRPGFFSVVWPEGSATEAEIFEVAEGTADAPSPGHARPLYFIALASGDSATLASLVPRLSVLADRGEWVYRDYANVTRAFTAAQKREAALSAELAEARARNDDTARERASGLADLERQRVRLAADLARAHEETVRRASFRWWLALPWRRLSRALRGLPPGG
jgi:SAM-dependent methyltransferase